MVVIRREQFEAFGSVHRQRFENWMARHIEQCFPQTFATLGDAAVRNAIRLGVRKAESYGITGQRDTCLFIDVMFAFGRDFDSDRGFPWASETLRSKAHPTDRIDRLHASSMEHAAEARGIAP